MSLDKKLLVALGLGVGLTAADAEARERTAPAARVIVDRNIQRKSKPNRRKGPKRTRVPACGVRSDLRDYKCLTMTQAANMGLDPSAGMPWTDYKYVNQSTRGKIGLFTPGRVYVGCPGPSGTSRERRCYDITNVKPRVGPRGPPGPPGKDAPAPKPEPKQPVCSGNDLSACNTEGKCIDAKLNWYDGKCNVDPKKPTCSQETPSACGDEQSCVAAKCNWYDGKCHTEPKPEEPKPEEKHKSTFTLYAFGEALFDADGNPTAQYGAGVEHTPSRWFSYGVELGAGNNSSPHSDRSETSGFEVGPVFDNDGNQLRGVEEQDTWSIVSQQNDSRNYGLARARAAINIIGNYLRAFVSAGVRVGKENTTRTENHVIDLVRDPELVGADGQPTPPGTPSNTERDSSAFVSGEFGGGLEGCLEKKLFGINGQACLNGKALYDTRTGKTYFGPGIKLGGSW
jgi:hypothetical protein